MRNSRAAYWVVCVDYEGYPASLEAGKIYRAYVDRAAQSDGLVRVVDESGEDYLYPARRFERIEISERAERALGRRAGRRSRRRRTSAGAALIRAQ